MNSRFDSTSVVVSAGRVSTPGSIQSWEMPASARYVGSERSGAAMMSSNAAACGAVSDEICELTIERMDFEGSSAPTIVARSVSNPSGRLVTGSAAASVAETVLSMSAWATSEIWSRSGVSTVAGIWNFSAGATGSTNVPDTSWSNRVRLMVEVMRAAATSWPICGCAATACPSTGPTAGPAELGPVTGLT